MTFAPRRSAARPSLREQITEELRGAVITGEMRPGELYSAPALAEQFGVSATPVREAMLDLVGEGLMEPVRNKGFRVTEPSEKELDDLTEVRMMLEVPACARLAERYQPAWAEQIAELRGLATEIVTSAAARDLIGYLAADRHFHLALLALADNAELVAVVGRLRARSRLPGLADLAESGHLARSSAEHAELLDLIQAGDVAGTAALMKRHIAHVRGLWAGRAEGPA